MGEQGGYWSACSLVGPQREHNSDSVAVKFSGTTLGFVVADGVGSLPGSPIASTAAVNAAAEWIIHHPEIDATSVPSLMKEVDRAVKSALESGDRTGATTLVALAISAWRSLLLAVGDSEVIAVHKSGPAQRLTPVDHLPHRPNILTAWIDGKEPYEPHIIPLSTLPNRLCLMTDGVCGVLSDVEIADIVRSVPANAAAQRLVTAARAAGSKDDASCIVVSRDIIRNSTSSRSRLLTLRPFGHR